MVKTRQSGAPGALLPSRLQRFARPGVPKYLALRDAIASAVAADEWPAGTRIPNEAELAAGLPLSLGTIQRALRLLVEDGVIVRRQGQGTFVAAAESGRMHGPLHCRFLDDGGEGYLPVFPHVIRRSIAGADGPWAGHLACAACCCIERVIGIAHEFKVFSRFYVDPRRLPTFARAPTRDLDGANFKELIFRECGEPVGALRQLLSLDRADVEIAARLGVARRSPLQKLEVFAYVGTSSPVYYQELLVPPNARRLHLAASGRDAGVRGW